MRAALPLALLTLLALAPLAAAQVPDPVPLACGALGAAPQVRDQVPLCPREDPQPADPAAEPHEHPAPPAVPEDPQGLVQDAQEAAQGVVQDPPSAPSRLAGFVATVVAFVKGLLHLPVAGAIAVGHGLGAAGDAIHHAGAAVAQAAGGAAHAAEDGISHALAAVAGLFHHADAPRDAAPALPVARDAPVPAAKGLLQTVGRLTKTG